MIRFSPCNCDAMRLARLERKAWMRLLLPGMRLWVCTACGTRFLASKERVAGAPKDNGATATSR